MVIQKGREEILSLFFNKMTKQNKDLLAVLLICLAVFSVYINTLPNSFIFDDRHMILDNNYIKNLRHIPSFFKGKITSEPIVKGMYRPVLMLSLAFNYLTGGLNPYGYHIINILIHFLNAVFLYLFLKLFLRELSFTLRLGITLIFCLHPINTEAVTYISCRSDLLCSFFILSGLYAYIQSRLRDSPLRRLQQPVRGLFLYLSSLGLYILALLTKEIGLVFLGLIAAYEFVYTKDLKRLFLRLLPFILLTLVYLILIKVVFGSVFGLFGKVRLSPIPIRPLSANILTQSAVSFYYLYLFFFPLNLCIDHNFPIITDFTNPLGLIPLILIIALIAACLFLRRRILPLICFSCLWYFICLLPKFYARLNLISAEHQAYLAYIPLYFILGYLFSKWRFKKIYPVRDYKATGKKSDVSNGVYLRQLFLFILGLFFLLTLIRNFQWRNEYSLWKSTLKVNPDSGIAQGSLGLYLANKGFSQDGKRYFEQSAASAPIETTRISSMLNLAINYASQGEPEKGLRILEQNRDYLKRVNRIGFLKTLGFVYFQMGKHEQSKAILEEIIRLYPESAKLKAVLGWQYLKIFADKQKARQYLQSAIQDDPDTALAHLGLGAILENEDLKQAIKEYKKVIKLAPGESNAYYRLGLIYAQKLLSTQAEWYFKKTIELSPKFAPAYYNLCIFYLSLPEPDYEHAEEYFDKAKSLGYKVDLEIKELIQKKEILIK